MSTVVDVRLVLLRHGESEWNAQGRWQGHRGTGLTAAGRSQARAAAATAVERYPDVRLLARSDLQRVAETAAPLEERLDVPVVVDRRLRELDVGAWAGRTRAEVAELDPAAFAAWERGDDVRIDGGEGVADLRRRVAAALGDVAAATAAAGGGTALVVTSGGCVRAAAVSLLGLDGGAWRELDGVANGSLTEFALGPGGPRLVRWAATDHLGGDAVTAGVSGVPSAP